ncbi:MAG TPA: dihydrofolate reductase family protein [Candidatus Acidoferrum sp.]|nr:dihydrofolate reductase family protein [Candidatus Acidoferrum sp.]
MRRIRYRVAMSLDGYIAGPNGEADWIVMDPDVDFAAIWKEFDAILVGRKTFDVMARAGNTGMPGVKTYVVSRTLKQEKYPNVSVLSGKIEGTVASLRRESGKDIWLFGGGELFRSLLDAGLVDTVEVSVVPVLLGTGIPLLPPPARQYKMKLTSQKAYKTGIVALEYALT